MSNKATVESLNELHGLVAKELTSLVKKGDLKAIEKAIGFLKNNNISADIVESKETKDLFTTIDEMKSKEGVQATSVEDILAMYS